MIFTLSYIIFGELNVAKSEEKPGGVEFEKEMSGINNILQFQKYAQRTRAYQAEPAIQFNRNDSKSRPKVTLRNLNYTCRILKFLVDNGQTGTDKNGH